MFKTLVIVVLSLGMIAAVLLVRRSPAVQANPATRPAAPATRPRAAAERPLLKIVERDQFHRDVFVFVRGAWINLTRFSTPQSIEGAAVSPNGKWAYVWHCERPPRMLSIYDLNSLQRVSAFQPGFGGNLGWTPGNVLFHGWGCGTNCHEYGIYDVHGQTIASGNVSGIETSPGLAFVATFPTLDAAADPIMIRDLRTLAIVYRSDESADVRVVVDDIDWGENRVATIRYFDSKNQARTLQVQLPGQE